MQTKERSNVADGPFQQIQIRVTWKTDRETKVF